MIRLPGDGPHDQTRKVMEIKFNSKMALLEKGIIEVS